MGVDKPGSRAWTNVLKAVFLRRGGVIPKGSGVSLGGEIHDGLLGRRVRIGSRAYLRRMRELAAEAAPLDIAGGTITTPTGYKVATLTSSGTLTVTGSGWLNGELVPAGGGGASVRAGGGGGGMPKHFRIWVTPGVYAVVIGAGGLGASANNAPNPAQNGGDTTAFGITALGGGAGGAAFRASGPFGSPNGSPGGNGGGAGPWGTGNGVGGAATDPAGYPGGNGHDDVSATNRSGGGGGGAGGPGSDGAPASDASGGPGVASICPGVSATYCAGGKGGDYVGTNPSAGINPGDGGDGAAQQVAGANGAKGIAHFWIEAAA